MKLHTTITEARSSDSPSAPISTLLFLHGFLGSSADWAPVCAELQGRYRILTIDLPSHGSSPALCLEHSTFESVVELLAETIRSSVTEPLAAVGYSLGGRLLMGLAARHPALFSSLTIISAFPGYLSEADRSARAAADNEWNQRLRELPVREFLSQWYKQPIFASSSWSPDFTAAVLRSREESLRRPHDFARMLEVTSASRMPSYWEFLRTSLIPITYVAGERDHRYCQVAADIRANNPKIRTRIIENAGHLVINEKAREVSMVLRDSLG